MLELEQSAMKHNGYNNPGEPVRLDSLILARLTGYSGAEEIRVAAVPVEVACQQDAFLTIGTVNERRREEFLVIGFGTLLAQLGVSEELPAGAVVLLDRCNSFTEPPMALYRVTISCGEGERHTQIRNALSGEGEDVGRCECCKALRSFKAVLSPVMGEIHWDLYDTPAKRAGAKGPSDNAVKRDMLNTYERCLRIGLYYAVLGRTDQGRGGLWMDQQQFSVVMALPVGMLTRELKLMVKNKTAKQPVLAWLRNTLCGYKDKGKVTATTVIELLKANPKPWWKAKDPQAYYDQRAEVLAMHKALMG
jgi:hypothetical protein